LAGEILAEERFVGDVGFCPGSNRFIRQLQVVLSKMNTGENGDLIGIDICPAKASLSRGFFLYLGNL
jgi:hypothetical protein